MGEGGEDDLMLSEGVPPLENLSVSDGDITRKGDGSVHAEIDQDGQHVVLEIGSDGRLRHITASSPDEGTWEMTFEYGSRSAISAPKDFKLLPATVELSQDQPSGALQTWTVVSSPEEPPLQDLEVRVQDWGFGYYDDEDYEATSGSPLASFPLDGGSPQSLGNYTFTFRDADHDGKLSAGDSYSLHDAALEADAADGEYSIFPDYQVVLYDVLADGEVNSGFAEMPSPAWLALGALAFAGLAARRRR
jgi:MYXO-CTERM domain-containing protein